MRVCARWHVFVCVSVHAKKKKEKKKTVIWPWWACIMPGCDTHRELYKSTHTWPYKEQLFVQMVDQWILALQVCRLNTYLQFVDHFMSNWDIILQAEARAQSPNIFQGEYLSSKTTAVVWSHWGHVFTAVTKALVNDALHDNCLYNKHHTVPNNAALPI